jgi:hypothetical protein
VTIGGGVPSPGRVVHYRSYGTPGGEYASECRAAIVTEVTSQAGEPITVGLAVFNPAGVFFKSGVPHAEYAEPHPPGSWHWPERV